MTLFQAGTNFSVSLGCESLAEMERLFAALGENGSVNLPIHDAFWGGRLGALAEFFSDGTDAAVLGSHEWRPHQ